MTGPRPAVPGDVMAYRDAVQFLEARGQAIKPGLARMRTLVGLLDNPQTGYPSIHVAGTNGKSSTTRIAAAVLAGQGIFAGAYLSPHLQSIRERYLLNGDPVTRDEFAAIVSYLVPYVAEVESRLGEQVSYFEAATAVAFEMMSDKAVGAGVFETGMGGAWDATNVMDGAVAVLTPIDVDHAEFLGQTPLENAREKSGIIKPGAPVVCAPQIPEVLALIEETAAALGSPVLLAGRDFGPQDALPAVGGMTLAVQGLHARYPDLLLPLHGVHQALNASVAIAACEALTGRPLPQENLVEALRTVQVPGRMEVLPGGPPIVLDGAHNPAGAAVLGPAVRAALGGRRTVFVVSVFADKDVAGILAALAPHAAAFVLTRSSSPRAASAQSLLEAVPAGKPARAVESMPEAIEAALGEAGPEGAVVITGSLYAVGEARSLLLGPVD